MEKRADILRRKIQMRRGNLRDGVAADLAITYIREIIKVERELTRLSRSKQNPEQTRSV